MRHGQQVVKSAVTFALVCPLVVWIVGGAYLLISTSTSADFTLGAWLSPYVAMLAFLSLVSAYVVAVGPAMAAGAAFGWLYGHRAMSPLVAAVMGFALGFCVAFSTAYIAAWLNASISLPPSAVGLVGGFSALMAALVAVRRLGANSSFKPKPLRGSA